MISVAFGDDWWYFCIVGCVLLQALVLFSSVNVCSSHLVSLLETCQVQDHLAHISKKYRLRLCALHYIYMYVALNLQ